MFFLRPHNICFCGEIEKISTKYTYLAIFMKSKLPYMQADWGPAVHQLLRDGNSWVIFFSSPLKHMLWVLIRSASLRHF